MQKYARKIGDRIEVSKGFTEQEALARLFEYEGLKLTPAECKSKLENSIQLPPCKVGDMVYQLKEDNKCERCEWKTQWEKENPGVHISHPCYDDISANCPETRYEITEHRVDFLMIDNKTGTLEPCYFEEFEGTFFYSDFYYKKEDAEEALRLKSQPQKD